MNILDLKELLYKSSMEIGKELNESQLLQFIKYKDLLLDWNKKVNLTSITDEKEIILKHFVDSISVSCGIDIKAGTSIIDVGTGAGFPGVPIKIVFPETNITLLDSVNKKLLFIESLINELGLKDIRCVHSRAEDGGNNVKFREMYDMCISRAVANLTVLSEYCLPFVKVGGVFISLKGPEVDEEIEVSKQAVKILGGEIEEVKKIEIPYTDIKHTLIIVKKVRQTPLQYPRKAGKASKNPIE